MADQPHTDTVVPTGAITHGGNVSRRRGAIEPYVFVAPAALLFLIFTAGPIMASVALTFFRWDGLSERQFIGLDNYATLVHDSQVRTVLLNTVEFVAGAVIIKMVLALFLAVLVDRYLGQILRTTFRAVIFFPVIVSGVAIGIIWTWLMNTNLGLINYYLGQIGITPISWLNSSSQALWSLILVDVWRTVGFSFVVFTAGLQGVPRDLYEVSAIDGAGGWGQFWSITLPLISPTTFFLMIINMIGAFQFFDLSYVMTLGGPGDATRTIVYYIFDVGFQYFRFGYASTVAVLLFVILAILTFVQVRLSGRWVYYG